MSIKFKAVGTQVYWEMHDVLEVREWLEEKAQMFVSEYSETGLAVFCGEFEIDTTSVTEDGLPLPYLFHQLYAESVYRDSSGEWPSTTVWEDEE